MMPTDGQPVPPRRVYLVNILFWQCVGHLIGGLLPGAALAPVFPYLLPANPSEHDIFRCLWVAGLMSPATAFVGGLVGSIIGFRDKTLPWRSAR